MDRETIAIIVAGFAIAVGSVGPALAEGRAASAALDAIARQPDERNTLTRTLFVSLAMIESTAIYCLVVALLLLFKATPLLKEATEAVK